MYLEAEERTRQNEGHVIYTLVFEQSVVSGVDHVLLGQRNCHAYNELYAFSMLIG